MWFVVRTRVVFQTWIWLTRHWTRAWSSLLIAVLEKLISFDGSLNSDATNTKILGLSLSSKFDWGPYLVSVAKTGSKGIGAFFRSIKFLSFEIALYHYKFYKSAIRFSMEYSSHVWAGALSCHLDMCWINVRSGYAGLLVLHLLPLLSPWLIVEMIIWTGWTGSTFLFSWEIHLLF